MTLTSRLANTLPMVSALGNFSFIHQLQELCSFNCSRALRLPMRVRNITSALLTTAEVLLCGFKRLSLTSLINFSILYNL